MKETILLYHFSDPERLSRVKQALLPLGMRLKAVKKEEYLQPIGYLAGVKEIEPVEEQYGGEEFEKEMMVMAGLSSARVDAVILGLRKAGAGRVDYKAVLTPTNQYWDSLHLYREISREHAAMSQPESGRRAEQASGEENGEPGTTAKTI